MTWFISFSREKHYKIEIEAHIEISPTHSTNLPNLKKPKRIPNSFKHTCYHSHVITRNKSGFKSRGKIRGMEKSGNDQHRDFLNGEYLFFGTKCISRFSTQKGDKI
jgi:hypothetical protein